MKQTYISLVLQIDNPQISGVISKLSEILQKSVKFSELILVRSYGSGAIQEAELGINLPVSVVYTRMLSTKDEMVISGLARAVGDYVILLQGDPHDFDTETLHKLLDPSSEGSEISRITFQKGIFNKFFYSFVNYFRKGKPEIIPGFAYCFSRRALNSLINESEFETNVDIALSNLPVEVVNIEEHNSRKMSKGIGFRTRVNLISRGTSLGTFAPLVLALISGVLALTVAIYAIVVYFVSGRTPEGWTTLMVALGASQSTVLGILAFVIAKINGIEQLIKKNADATFKVEVFPNSKSINR